MFCPGSFGSQGCSWSDRTDRLTGVGLFKGRGAGCYSKKHGVATEAAT
jgi:hypothetical protein